MKTLPRALAAATAALALLLAGCAAGDDTTASETAATPRPGGELTVGIPDWCGAYDKQQTSGCTFSNIQVTDNLVDQDPETGEIVPWLATDWTISDDGRRYEFTLQEGVTFSNGEPLDAEAVKLNWDSIVELGKQGKAFQSSAYLLGYTGSEVLDEHRVAITFEEAKAGFLQSLSEAPLGLVAPETTRLTADERVDGVIGSGPFVIDEVVQDQRVVLTKREDYGWPSPVRANQGPAYLDTLTFLIIPEASVRLGALQSGTVDAISLAPTHATSTIRVDELPGDVELFTSASAGIVFTLYPNYAHPILSQPEVRRAVQRAIDRQEVKDVLLDEPYEPATSIVSTTFPTYADLSEELSQDDDEVASVLAASGWELGSDGIYAKDGERLTFDLQYTSSDSTPLFELLQQQLRANGIDLTLQQVTEAQSTANLESGDWGLTAGNLTRPDPDVFLSAFSSEFSSRVAVDPDEELLDLLYAQAVELDPDARAADSAEIQRIIVEEGLAFPVHEMVSLIATSSDVHDVSFTAPWWAVFGDAWIEG